MSNIGAPSFATPFWNPNYTTPPDGVSDGSDPVSSVNDGVARGSRSIDSPSVSGPALAETGRRASDDMLKDLLRWEGDVGHMYLDHHGLVTVGIGNLIASPSSAQQLPFVDKQTGRPATATQIADAFAAVKAQHGGRWADAYAGTTTLRLSENVVRTLAATRVENEFLPGLRRNFPGFDGYPAPAQRALLDMAYNMGVGGVGRFHNLRQACEAGDWKTAATECHRRTCRAERNEWTKDLFLNAAGQSAPRP